MIKNLTEDEGCPVVSHISCFFIAKVYGGPTRVSSPTTMGVIFLEPLGTAPELSLECSLKIGTPFHCESAFFSLW